MPSPFAHLISALSESTQKPMPLDAGELLRMRKRKSSLQCRENLVFIKSSPTVLHLRFLETMVKDQECYMSFGYVNLDFIVVLTALFPLHCDRYQEGDLLFVVRRVQEHSA